MQHATIIGLGQIGASIGLGLRRWATQDGGRDAVLAVTGFDRDLDCQHDASRNRAVDRTERNLSTVVRDADLIVVCVSPLEVRQVFRSIAPHLRPGVVVIDTTSTSQVVMQWAAELLPSTASFVGSHPMAGKARGTGDADADLFNGVPWYISPSAVAEASAVHIVLGMIHALGAEPQFSAGFRHGSTAQAPPLAP